jgi:hypothetical protein
VLVAVGVAVLVGVAVAPPLLEGPGSTAVSSRMSPTATSTAFELVAPICTSDVGVAIGSPVLEHSQASVGQAVECQHISLR